MVYYFNFVECQCISLTFALALGAFKSWPQNFGLFWTDLRFQNFALGNGKSWKSQYCSYLVGIQKTANNKEICWAKCSLSGLSICNIGHGWNILVMNKTGWYETETKWEILSFKISLILTVEYRLRFNNIWH